MKNKVSSIALLLTLTACGGGNSPVSTLPSSTKPTLSVAEQRAASQKVFSVKSDNLTSIISKAEENIGTAIDISNYDAIETAYKTAISVLPFVKNAATSLSPLGTFIQANAFEYLWATNSDNLTLLIEALLEAKATNKSSLNLWTQITEMIFSFPS